MRTALLCAIMERKKILLEMIFWVCYEFINVYGPVG